MANFCLMPAAIDKFRAALIDGTISPEKLSAMTSEERNKLFGGIVGKDAAKETNALFESKMLLKNQKYAYVSWAKKVAGITPEVRRDLIARVEKLNKVLDPEDQKQFLHDLAATRLGVDVSQDEAKQIADMSKQVSDTKALQRPDGTFKSEDERMAYGRAKVALGNYVSQLKLDADRPSIKTLAAHPARAASHLAGMAKSIKAALDNSALFRQGWKTLFTNPRIWQKNARQSFVDIVKEFGGKPVMDEVHADIVSRPNYDRYQKMKLATSNIEEAYPSHFPGKIPILGRAYKASESAYTGFLYRQRADIADKYIDIAKNSGVNVDDTKELLAMGKLVNSLTGRGHLGALEPAANTVNNVFFSPRSVKSNIDTLTAHQFQKNITPFVRKRAAVETTKVILGTAAVLAIANAVRPGSVELDPRSADFGKIKIGDTRFDVTGGMDAIATLAARVIRQSSKSTSTGQVTKLNSGYGSQTGQDVLVNFLDNKLSPAAAVAKDLIKQQNQNGGKPTIRGEVNNFITPLPATNILELRSDPRSANNLAASIADSLGIVSNTFGASNKTWATAPTKNQLLFKQKVGNQKFQEANNLYNQKYSAWAADNLPTLKDQDPATVAAITSAAKAKIEKSVFKQYGFKAPKATKTKVNGALKSRLLQTAN